ncbi:MAG: sulfurtransferase [Acidobacteria bacterium]|nr:sulfurtransferase [Acidobacteriota bacterium]
MRGIAVLFLLLPTSALADPVNPVVSAPWLVEARRSLGTRLVIAEASWEPPAKPRPYDSEHIPGAIHIDTDVFENGSPRWHLLPAAELHAAIGALGIAPDSLVVVYGNQPIAAARVWWILEYAGVAEVRYLDGGLGAWKRAGQPVESAPTVLPRTRFAAPLRPDVLATTSYVRKRWETSILTDVRSEREYRGEISGYSYLDAKGRIPGARPAGDAGDEAGPYQTPDGTLRNPEEIRRLWQQAGILDGREIVFYCGSGWRSSLTFLYARRMGLRNIRNYSDGWSGWSTTYEQTANGTQWRQKPSRNPVVGPASARGGL